MRVLILNGSPAGAGSITLQTMHYIGKRFPEHTYECLDVGAKIRDMEKNFAPCLEAVLAADLIVFCYPVYTFLVPSQLHRFLELLKDAGPDLSGRYATQVTTSKHFYDVTAHRFVEDNCNDLGLPFIRGLSADMEDLLTKKGQEEAENFFRRVLWSMEKGFAQPPLYPKLLPGEREKSPVPETDPADAAGSAAVQEESAGKVRVALVYDDTADTSGALRAMMDAFSKEPGISVTKTDIGRFPFRGGCLGCFHCAADGTCVYKDGFESLLRERIQTADATVYAFTVRDHSMGSRFKLYDDRQFCNGHRTVTMGKPVGYLIDGNLSQEPNLLMVLEARAEVGGNHLAGIVSTKDTGRRPEEGCRQLAASVVYAVENRYEQPGNFYGAGGRKIFRDLIYEMQGMMREDHRFYRAHGFYDFPQKKKGKIIGMYLVGLLMRSGMGKAKMREGMLMPYRKLMEKAQKGTAAGDGGRKDGQKPAGKGEKR